MNKFISLAAVVFMGTLLAMPAAAQTATPSPAGAPEQMSPERQKEMADHKAEEQLRFNDRKAEMTKDLGDRITEMQAWITEMQQKQTCIQGAANPQAMQACFPHMNGGGEHHWDHGHDHGAGPGTNQQGGQTPQH